MILETILPFFCLLIEVLISFSFNVIADKGGFLFCIDSLHVLYLFLLLNSMTAFFHVQYVFFRYTILLPFSFALHIFKLLVVSLEIASSILIHTI